VFGGAVDLEGAMSGPIVAEYGRPGDFLWRRVSIDPGRGTITFERCHQPARFLSFGAEPEFTCSLDDVRGVCWNRARGVGRVLEVVTRAGRARLPESAAGFNEVRSAVEARRPTGRLRWYEYPAAQFALAVPVIVAAAGLGLALWGSVPPWAYAVALFGAMALLPVIPLVARWRGRPMV
jgi:hypothetical protein